MRFGASAASCRQAMNLGFDWAKQRLNPAALEEMQQVQQQAEEHMQKVCHTRLKRPPLMACILSLLPGYIHPLLLARKW